MGRNLLKRPNMAPLTEKFAEAYKKWSAEAWHGLDADRGARTIGLREALEELGIKPTGKGLGQFLGISEREAQKILSGSRQFTARQLEAIQNRIDAEYAERMQFYSDMCNLDEQCGGYEENVREAEKSLERLDDAEGALLGNSHTAEMRRAARLEVQVRTLVEGALVLPDGDRRILLGVLDGLMARNRRRVQRTRGNTANAMLVLLANTVSSWDEEAVSLDSQDRSNRMDGQAVGLFVSETLAEYIGE